MTREQIDRCEAKRLELETAIRQRNALRKTGGDAYHDAVDAVLAAKQAWLVACREALAS